MNRAFDAPPSARTLHALLEHYDDEHVPLFFAEITGGRELADAAATQAGLIRYRRAQLHLVRDTRTIPTYATSLEVGLARPTDMTLAAAIFCMAFDAEPSLINVIASLIDAPRWEIVVARDAGRPVAMGLIYVADELAYFMGAATSPAYRERGAQAALIAERLLVAQRRGCQMVAVRTGEPVAQDRQHSQHNLQRGGFHLIGRSESYAPPGIVWTHGRRHARR